MKKIKKVLAIFIPIFMVMVACFGVAMPVRAKKGDNVSELSSSNYTYAEDTGAHTAAKSKKGGSIYLAPNTKYTMKNGTIKNKLKQYGGAVYVSSGATFTMTGGTITGCQAQYGGAIYVENGGTCIIDGGTIKGNKAEVAPAIYAETGANVQIISGDVDDNSIAEFKEAFKLGPIPEGVTVVRNGENIQSGTIVYTNDILTITFPQTEIKDDVYVESSVKGAERESGTNDYKVTDNVRIIHQELAATLDKLEFNLVEDHYEVRGKTSSISGEVIIPSYHAGQPVTSIRNWSIAGAFQDYTQITSVKIPEGVTNIETYAFRGCSNLASVTMPESVVKIGERAFNNCRSLTSITIPKNVTSIDRYAFDSCYGLTEINYNATKCQTSNLAVFGSAGVIKEGITLTIGDNVEIIPASIFVAQGTAPKITSIKMGKNVSTIGAYAFNGCKYLTSITIPEKVTSIGTLAFEDCTGLTEIRYNATNCADQSSNTLAFQNAGTKGADLNVIIGDDVERLPSYLFRQSSNITSVFVGKGVTSIGERVFESCTGLNTLKVDIANSSYTSRDQSGKETNTIINKTTNTLIAGCKTSEIPNDGSVTIIGENAFYGQSDLENINIPDSVTKIDAYAFAYCTVLTSITIPEKVTSIGQNAFDYCRNLTEINYNATNCADLSGYTFYNAGQDGDGITVTIGDNVERIPKLLFAYTPKTTTLKFGKNVTSIGERAFSNCSGITSLTISENVISIGEEAFINCTGITEIIFNATNCTDVSTDSFKNVGTSETGVIVTIGDNVESLPSYLFYNSANISSVTIGKSVASIGKQCFSFCTALNNLKVDVANSVYTSQDKNGKECNIIIDKAAKKLVAGCKTSELPNDGSITTIGELAFQGHSGLTSVIIPDGVTSIGKGAFESCFGLENVVIPEGMPDIGSCAFYYCTSLTSITIPGNVTNIDSSAFYNCTNLNEVIIESSAVYNVVADSQSANGYLTYYIQSGGTIKVLQDVDDGTNTYLSDETKFTKTTTEIDGKTYNVYTKI